MRPKYAVVGYDDARVYAESVTPFLSRDEARNNLPLGVLSNLQRGLIELSDPPVLLTVVGPGDDLVMTASMTPPWNLIVTSGPVAALRLVVDHLARIGTRPPGVLGPDATGREFARLWAESTGVTATESRRERIYQLDAVSPPRGVAGALRAATTDDLDLALGWLAAFCTEVNLPDRSTRELVSRRIADQRMFLWVVDGEPVTLAGWGGDTPNGGRVGPVYTPPEHRRRGFASAATAAVSQRILDRGRRYCFLFTDLANPTSNKIYQDIGYRPVDDVVEMSFAAA
ncbi:MAG: GNAT family N-acetyltransferase [Mycobacteriales bacterium]|nr:GNAT family N-acetyltransferase [Frankia sp.]